MTKRAHCPATPVVTSRIAARSAIQSSDLRQATITPTADQTSTQMTLRATLKLAKLSTVRPTCCSANTLAGVSCPSPQTEAPQTVCNCAKYAGRSAQKTVKLKPMKNTQMPRARMSQAPLNCVLCSPRVSALIMLSVDACGEFMNIRLMLLLHHRGSTQMVSTQRRNRQLFNFALHNFILPYALLRNVTKSVTNYKAW